MFREAAINLLIHQDYGDHSRKAVIKFFRDGIQFWNPGDVFGDDSRLWEPQEKEVRNPIIVMGMRRIAMCEQAGTGLRMMRSAWVNLGHKKPTFTNDRKHKAFEFFLPDLDKDIDMASDLAKAMFADTLTGVESGVGSRVESRLESQLESRLESRLESNETKVLKLLENTKLSKTELASKLGLKMASGQLHKVIRSLLSENKIEMTIPDRPNSRLQRYRITKS